MHFALPHQSSVDTQRNCHFFDTRKRDQYPSGGRELLHKIYSSLGNPSLSNSMLRYAGAGSMLIHLRLLTIRISLTVHVTSPSYFLLFVITFALGTFTATSSPSSRAGSTSAEPPKPNFLSSRNSSPLSLSHFGILWYRWHISASFLIHSLRTDASTRLSVITISRRSTASCSSLSE